MDNMGIINIAFTTFLKKKSVGIALGTMLRFALTLEEVEYIESSVDGSVMSDVKVAAQLAETIEEFRALTMEILEC